MTGGASTGTRRLALSLFVVIAALTSGCTTVRFNERSRLDDRTMRFDPDPLDAEMVGHVLAPREGSVGGYSPVGAGGCGCF